jgi:hypothetical protein
MKPSSKIALVTVGYAAAFVVAALVVGLYIAVMDSPERQASSGMSAFSDSLLFLGVLGLASIPATCAALYFLRPFHAFWNVLAVCALGIAATGIAALVSVLRAGTDFLPGAWSIFSPIRVLLAPLLAMAFFLSSLFAPTRRSRIAFFSVVVAEAVVFAWAVLLWLGSSG